jgi:predicted dehydrogenase
MYRVGVIGCGAIFERHVESIENNDNFVLSAVCDTNKRRLIFLSDSCRVPGYKSYKKMIQEEDLNFIIIATPNSLHYEQALHCLKNKCDILLEKPAVLDPKQIKKLKAAAIENKTKAYVVLQVRLNPVIQKIKELLDKNILGKVRGVGLIQRWQRPEEYFDNWRGEKFIGGGTLHECGIHYIDIMCYLFGKPQVVSATSYNTKHKNVDVEDTVYSLLDFGDYGATMEITISSEPKNIECSIAVMTDKGYIKLGGKALDKIIEAKFASHETEKAYQKVISDIRNSKKPNFYKKYEGSCPNHPELYSRLEDFDLYESLNAIELIDEIYQACGLKYYN